MDVRRACWSLLGGDVKKVIQRVERTCLVPSPIWFECQACKQQIRLIRPNCHAEGHNVAIDVNRTGPSSPCANPFSALRKLVRF